MLDVIRAWPLLLTALAVVLSLTASGHAILRKRDSRAVVGWLGFIWLVPFGGAAAYALLGVNRIRRTALELQRDRRSLPPGRMPAETDAAPAPRFEPSAPLARLLRLGDRITHWPLTHGNAVAPLIDGDEAYPQMLAAIDGAERSITLCTYIFDNDAVGARFADALAQAVRRGVPVRVLIDAVGVRYAHPPMHRRLKRQGVPVALFLPTWSPASWMFANLRSHRKCMVVDGKLAFTGGMNIRAGHQLAASPRHPVRDIHFRVEGPVVAQLQRAFAEDWSWTTRERLEDEPWFTPLASAGEVTARAISDGPDADMGALRTVMLGAITAAQRRVTIMTPYFLPDQALIAALTVAALKGIRVDIVLPSRGNIRPVQWATQAMLWQVLGPGCRVFLSPPPFDHSKLMLVDEAWALLGSTNWDPRSLRLNFELNVECLSPPLAARLQRVVDERIQTARPLALADIDGRPLPVRLRDGVARLFSPYL